MPHSWVDARRMNADEQLIVLGLRFFDVAKREHVGRAVLVLNYGFHCCCFSPLLPSAQRLSLISSRLLYGSRETVDLPSHPGMEDDECENANECARRERVDQKHSCRYDHHQV